MSRRKQCRREQKFSLLLLSVSRLISSGKWSLHELAVQHGVTDGEIKDILLSAKEEREQYEEVYKEGLR